MTASYQLLRRMSTGRQHCVQLPGGAVFAMAKFSETIKALRIAKQMSQAELGAVVGVTRGAVHQWEKGRSVPQINHLQDLARFFGVPMGVLLGGESAGLSVDAALRLLPREVAEALTASFLSTIQAVKKTKG